MKEPAGNSCIDTHCLWHVDWATSRHPECKTVQLQNPIRWQLV